jgi:prepilin-type processing-associated H-X9-DG protein/prepilin-type N-terminal cleavage/methylation domain-containing protein
MPPHEERSMSRRAPNAKGFTLVELLVVIGIIALLISMLLPALNKAREQANLINCQSNERAIGQLLQIYATDNNGYFPPAYSQAYWSTYADTLTLLNSSTHTTSPGFGVTSTTPPVVGSPTLSYNLEPAQDSLVFQDLDVPGTGWYAHATAYLVNARVFGIIDNGYGSSTDPLWDPYAPSGTALGKAYALPSGALVQTGYLPRRIGTVRRSAAVMMLWDGACQIIGSLNYGVHFPMTYAFDDYQATSGHGLCYPTPATTAFIPPYYVDPVALGAPVLAGSNASSAIPGSVTKSYLANANVDITSTAYNGQFGFDANEMRFRHMGNTTANFLFVDGHVESRTLGTVLAQDVCLNPR